MNQKNKTQSGPVREKKTAYWRGEDCADSEEEHRRMDEQLQLLNKAIHDSMGAISIADLNGNLIYNNPACISMLGYDNTDEISGKNIARLVKDTVNYRKAMREALICGSTTAEFIAIKKDGTESIVEARISTVVDPAGKPMALIASLVDITKRKQAEEEIRRFKTVTDKASYGVIIATLQGEIIYSNETYALMHGYTPDELAGKHYSILYLEETLPSLETFRSNLMVRNGYATKELWRKRKDGTIFLSLTTAGLIKDEDGKPLYTSATAIDITERKRMEQVLQESEEHFRSLTESASDAIICINSHGNIHYWNNAAETIFGYSADETIGKSLIVMVPDRFRQAYQEAMNRVVSAGESEILSKTVEVNGLRKDGSEFPLELSLSSWETKEGTFFTGIVRDITARKQVEEELKKTQEQLQRSRVLASLGEMTAGIAHEVNNPLGSVLLYSELLIASDISSQTRKDLKVIHHEAKRAARIMTDLLMYGRKVKTQMRRVNLHKVLTKVLSMRRYRQKVENISAVVCHKGGPLYVKGDFTQLMQVFINIILNAEEALEEKGQGNIIIQMETDEKWARVSIADNGPGIPEENLEKVFFPFFSTKKIGGGIGLGLSTCFGIITSHNGMIRAEQNEMGGATFVLDLPLATNTWRREEKAVGRKNG